MHDLGLLQMTNSSWLYTKRGTSGKKATLEFLRAQGQGAAASGTSAWDILGHRVSSPLQGGSLCRAWSAQNPLYKMTAPRSPSSLHLCKNELGSPGASSILPRTGLWWSWLGSGSCLLGQSVGLVWWQSHTGDITVFTSRTILPPKQNPA